MSALGLVLIIYIIFAIWFYWQVWFADIIDDEEGCK